MLAGKLEGGKFQITNFKFQINSNDQNFNALNLGFGHSAIEICNFYLNRPQPESCTIHASGVLIWLSICPCQI